MLTVLSVGYPLAAVTTDPPGGAEQVLAQLDRALVEAGHRSIVIAPEGSETAGELRAVPAVEGEIDAAARSRVHAAVRARIAETAGAVDVIHYHGIDFADYVAPSGPRQLVTLHLPIGWDPHAAFGAGLALVPVSESQARTAPPRLNLLPPIPNGVDLDRYRPVEQKKDYALLLGRVAPEKGFHIAVAAAKRAGVPLVAAGQLYPYPEHRAYFDAQVAPALDAERRFVGPVAGAKKALLLAEARCLLAPFTAPETSSLVAMEALASGTPVIAFRSGALPEVVEDGVTGFIVDDEGGMAAAIDRAGRIAPETCRAQAERRFPVGRMIAAYFELYQRLGA